MASRKESSPPGPTTGVLAVISGEGGDGGKKYTANDKADDANNNHSGDVVHGDGHEDDLESEHDKGPHLECAGKAENGGYELKTEFRMVDGADVLDLKQNEVRGVTGMDGDERPRTASVACSASAPEYR